MLRTLSIVLCLGLLACGGGGKPADRSPGDPADPEPDPGEPATSTTTCCCETYDLDTPDILYSTMPTSECAAQSGNCEDTDAYCQGE